MTPRKNINDTPEVQPTGSKTKPKATRKSMDATQIKVNNTTTTKKKTRFSLPPLCTPNLKEIESTPGSGTKSAKKVRRSMGAHSGVPIPMKMLKSLQSAEAFFKGFKLFHRPSPIDPNRPSLAPAPPAGSQLKESPPPGKSGKAGKAGKSQGKAGKLKVGKESLGKSAK